MYFHGCYIYIFFWNLEILFKVHVIFGEFWSTRYWQQNLLTVRSCLPWVHGYHIDILSVLIKVVYQHGGSIPIAVPIHVCFLKYFYLNDLVTYNTRNSKNYFGQIAFPNSLVRSNSICCIYILLMEANRSWLVILMQVLNTLTVA